MENTKTILKESIEKNRGHFKSEIGTLSVGRATPLLVEDILVDYYGTPTPLKQISTIAFPMPEIFLLSLGRKINLKKLKRRLTWLSLGLIL